MPPFLRVYLRNYNFSLAKLCVGFHLTRLWQLVEEEEKPIVEF